LAALLLGPLLALLAGEAYVRSRYPAYGDLWGAIQGHPTWVRELRPGASGRIRALTGEYDHGYAINAQGLREGREVGAPERLRRRILVVGDSNTFGLGVEDHEVWVRALDGADVEAVNAGWASGYAPDTACLFLEARCEELQPDVVIQQLTPANDLLDLAQRSVWHQGQGGRLQRITHRFDAVPDWIQALALPRFLALQVWPSWKARSRSASAEPAGEGPLTALEQEGLRRLRQMLERQRDFLAARGKPLWVLVFPDPRPIPLRRQAVLEVVEELGLPLIDPAGSPELEGVEQPFHREGHMTAAGNAAVGACARRWLDARPR
jgi:hypothetical protein